MRSRTDADVASYDGCRLLLDKGAENPSPPSSAATFQLAALEGESVIELFRSD